MLHKIFIDIKLKKPNNNRKIKDLLIIRYCSLELIMLFPNER